MRVYPKVPELAAKNEKGHSITLCVSLVICAAITLSAAS